MRRAARTDANQREVIGTLQALGWYVFDSSSLGKGFVDIVCARAGSLRLCEIKDGAKRKSARTLTPAEAACHRHFEVAGCPVVILESVADAEALR